MPNIIDVKNLTKRYGNFTAVDSISFETYTGETLGILGPNGAGKTTTLEMMEGLKQISEGTVAVDAHDVTHETRKVKSLIGVQLQASSFFSGLNLKELVALFGSLYGRKVDPLALLKMVELEDKVRSGVGQLSGGQKQRLSIAVALVNDPKVLFLDEPTTGLDPQARRHLWDLVTRIKRQGKTIVLTTHYMEEAEVLCDRVAIMDHAKIVALDTPANLLKTAGVTSSIMFRTDHEVSLEELKTLKGAQEATKEDHGYRIISKDPESTLPHLFQLEHERKFRIFNLQVRQATLEDVFLKLTGSRLRD